MSSSIRSKGQLPYIPRRVCLHLVMGALTAGAEGCATYSDIAGMPGDLDDATDVVAASSADDGGLNGDGVGEAADSRPGDSAGESDGAIDNGPPNDGVDGAVEARPVDATADGPMSGGADGADAQPVDAAVDNGTPCKNVNTGLLAHWTMDASSVVGTKLLDVSPNHNDGTLMGFSAPVTVSGKFGQALSYPASGAAYVNVPTLGLDQAAGGMNSISLWFYRDAVNVDDVLVLLPNSPRYDLWLTHKTRTSLCINTGRSECFGIQDDGLTGRWVHVVAIFANGPTTSGRLYVDGVDRNAACVTDTSFVACNVSATASQPVALGGQTDFLFHGLLDDVRIYRRALTSGEVVALYNGMVCP